MTIVLDLSFHYKETAARVDLDAIDKLCELFGVEVGELFERVATTDKTK
ncbi:MAG: helix-turn-helix transcriptional regulator [Sulfuritalea sp.]|nr:helix-turn-helix transcriptional regulator [Sulfuritalea sp.]